MSITCAIIDDEHSGIEVLKSYITNVSWLRLVGSYTDPEEAVSQLQGSNVDLIFVDVEMPSYPIGGLEVINSLGNKHAYIVTTAYQTYAIKAYDLDVVDYLSKPIRLARFLQGVNKAKLNISSSARVNAEHLYVRANGKHQQINLSTICYFESAQGKNYVSIHTEEGIISVRMTIQQLQKKLSPALFLRVHRAYIVAKSKVNTVSKNEILVRVQGKNHLIPVSDTYRKNLTEFIDQNTLRNQ